MNKLIIMMMLLLTTIFVSCGQPKKITMNMPDTMPPLLKVQMGLSPELKKEEVVFEKYVQTRIGNATATRLYANGDLYKIYLHSSQSLKDGNISWMKLGLISPKGLKEIQKISNNSVVDFITEDNYEIVHGPISTTKWYFYFDEPKFVRSQNKQWEFFCWQKPKFVCKVDKALEQYLIDE